MRLVARVGSRQCSQGCLLDRIAWIIQGHNTIIGSRLGVPSNTCQLVRLEMGLDEFDGRATIVSVWDERLNRMNVEFEQSVYDFMM